MQLLIIEDKPDMDSGLSAFLESKGHVVDTVGCGITSRHPALAGQYDAIVLDVMLPETDGLKLCRQLREEGCGATPILMITMRDSLNEKIAGMAAGADDYLVRSVAPSAIESRLRVLFRFNSHSRMNAR